MSAARIIRSWAAACGSKAGKTRRTAASRSAATLREAPEAAGPPWFWTDQYGENFQIVGLPETWDKTLWRGAPGDDRFTVIYLKGSKVVAGNTLNAPRDIRPSAR